MKAAVLANRGFEIRDVEEPVCGDGEILVKTLGCGICSGDLHLYRTRSEFAGEELWLGHEASGIVSAVGEQVSGVSTGDLITALGKPAYAEYFVTKPQFTAKLPPAIDPLYALGEPVGCCVHAGNRFDTKQGDKVALIGCGFMGLICGQIARYQGADFILAIDPLRYRRDMGERLLAATSIDPVSRNADEILRLYGDFDIVIEAAGSQSALDLSTNLVKKHGRIILVGYHQSNGGIRSVNMQQWNYKAIDVINGHVRRDDEKAEAMRQGMKLMESGHIKTKPLVSIYALDQVEQAFRDLSDGKPGLWKAVLRMES